MFYPFDSPFLQYLINTKDLSIVAASCRLVHVNIRRHQLRIILIWGHHVNGKTFFFSFLSDRSNDIISLKTFTSDYRNFKSFYNLMYIGKSSSDFFWLSFSVCFIIFKDLVSKGWSTQIKTNRQMRRILLFNEFTQYICESHNCGCI